jgi:serine/threonine protein kinase
MEYPYTVVRRSQIPSLGETCNAQGSGTLKNLDRRGLQHQVGGFRASQEMRYAECECNEILRGHDPLLLPGDRAIAAYTEKADIWSLGCIIYELLTFTQPFSAGNPLTVVKKIVDGDYDHLQEGGDVQYSNMLIGVIRKCMNANPKARPNSFELCQLMVPILMQQMDDLRGKDFKSL